MEEDFPDSPLSNERHCLQTETARVSPQDQNADRTRPDPRDQNPEGPGQDPESPPSPPDQDQLHREETDPPDTSQDQLVAPTEDQRPTRATGEESGLSPGHMIWIRVRQAQQSRVRGQRSARQEEEESHRIHVTYLSPYLCLSGRFDGKKAFSRRMLSRDKSPKVDGAEVL